jgi:hypothetical protein
MVKIAAERLDKEVVQERITLHGVFRGVTLETCRFDLKADTSEAISGTVADDLSEEDLVRISNLTNQQCVAHLERTTVSKIAGTPTVTYILIEAESTLEGALPNPK